MISDYDESHQFEAMPDDFECPLCMMVKTELYECNNCHQQSCRECNVSYSSKKKDTNCAQNKFECTTCHKVGEFM